MTSKSNPFLTFFLIMLTGIIPAVCLGIPGIIGLIGIASYYTCRELDNDTVYTVHKMYRYDIEKIQTTDYNQDYLDKFLENGRFQDDWYKKLLKVRDSGNLNTVVLQNCRCIIMEDTTHNPNDTLPKEKCLRLTRNKIKNERALPYYKVQERMVDQIRDLDTDVVAKYPLCLRKQLFTTKDCFADDQCYLYHNLQRTWFEGITDNRLDYHFSTETVRKMYLMGSDDYRSREIVVYEAPERSTNKPVFDQRMYNRFLESWKRDTLPPRYCHLTYGGALAYLEYLAGILKVKEDGHFILGVQAMVQPRLEDKRRDGLEFVDFELIDKYYLV